MKKLIIFTLLLSFFGCKQTVKTITAKDIEGNWECHISNSNFNVDLNLYFQDSTCHFWHYQDNSSTYSIKDNVLIITDSDGKKHSLGLTDLSKNKLTVVLKSNWLNDQLDLKKGDTLTFEKLKKNDNLEIKRITFKSSVCYGMCPSFKLQVDSQQNVLYEGIAHVDKSGFYQGKVDGQFWKLLVDKYVISNWIN